MNRVIVREEDRVEEYLPGDIFFSIEPDNVFMLAMIDEEYSLIQLDTGYSLGGSFDTAKKAVRDAKFVGRGMDISIKKANNGLN